MELIVKKDKAIKNKVLTSTVHGKFPYKVYLKMIGNSLYGTYIAVIDNKPIRQDNTVIDKIVIQLEEKMSSSTKKQLASNTQGMRPNTVNDKAVRYSVEEVNVLEVGQTPILVFRPAVENER